MLRTSHRSRVSAELLAALGRLPFVTGARFQAPTKGSQEDVITVTAPGERVDFSVIQRLSYLDRSFVNGLTSLAARAKRPMLLFARYVPRATGEALASAGINFIDQAGNLHVALGRRHSKTVLGHREPTKAFGERPLTSAQVQWRFALAARPDLVREPVRAIAAYAGVSKSMAALLRKDTRFEDINKPTARPQQAADLASAYTTVLRPKLLLGRFRSPDDSRAALTTRLNEASQDLRFRYALTGGAAAEALQHFYRAPETSLFLESWTPEIRQALRLLPDREGPVTALRSFGEVVFWREVAHVPLANPWLIYAELMQALDPRAREAAEELFREYLAR